MAFHPILSRHERPLWKHTAGPSEHIRSGGSTRSHSFWSYGDYYVPIGLLGVFRRWTHIPVSNALRPTVAPWTGYAPQVLLGRGHIL